MRIPVHASIVGVTSKGNQFHNAKGTRWRPLNMWFQLLPPEMLPPWFDHFDPVYPAIDKARHEAGYPGPCPVFADRKFPALCMSHPVIEYPMIIPDDIICCGPILQVSPPLEEIDKRLFDWISSRATVLVVLGSHIRMNKSEAQKILTALRILLDKRPDVQVLWKLMKVGDFQLDGADVDGDRLRVTSWLEADPMSLLRTGKLICVVNHGGSNSYHEALAYVFCHSEFHDTWPVISRWLVG
jgi:hypothetical protein